MGRRARNVEGFTLLEVLVATAIVSLAASAFVAGARYHMRSLEILRRHAEARTLLQAAVDRYQYGDGRDADSTVTGVHGEYVMRFRPDNTPGDGESPSPAPSGGGGHLVTSRVTVEWSDASSQGTLSSQAWRLREGPRD